MPGKSFFWAGRYSQNMNERTTLATELNVFARSSRPCRRHISIRRTYFSAILIRRCSARCWIKFARKPKVVGLDTMNYWIDGTPAPLETLKHVDILTINDDETRQLTGEHNLFRAAKHVFKMGPKTLIIKRGEHGALMVHDGFIFSVPAFPLEEVRDPTGAGDTFAGGFMGYLASKGRVNEQTLRIGDGLWFGAGELHGGEVRSGAAGEGDAQRDYGAGAAIRATDGVQAVD